MLRKKTILLCSTDRWSDVHLSKHNYALELVKSGNIVFFLNPPVSKKLKLGEVKITPTAIDNLFEISYRAYFPMFIKFRLPWVFSELMKIQAYLIRKKIKRKIDIVWDFNTHLLFSDLRLFNADINIFHAVDKINKKIKNKNADITFSVSHQILDMIESPDKPKIFLNHGLGPHFISAAKENKTFTINNPLKACYVGNLLIHCLDHDILKTIIEKHPEVEFHFLGPYEKKGGPFVNSSSEGNFRFINFLKEQTNVIFHGTVKSSGVINIIKDFDIFLLCYKNSESFASDNSHKILEYLSTGKVVVSSYLKEYINKDFIVMCKEESAEEFNFLFTNVVENISEFNSSVRSRERINYALDHTYERQLKKIEDALILNSILKESINAQFNLNDEHINLKQEGEIEKQD